MSGKITILTEKRVIVPEATRALIRHHLGYMNLRIAATYTLGVPAMIHTQFAIEAAMESVPLSAQPILDGMLERLNAIEAKIYCDVDLGDVSKVGSVEINPNRLRELRVPYLYARQSLANLFGVIPNPYDQRDWVRGPSLNVTVT